MISDNTACKGGCIYITGSKDLQISNSTITNNTSTSNTGGGIYLRASDLTLINTILWLNTPDQIFYSLVENSSGESSSNISYTNLQDGETGIVTNNNGDDLSINYADNNSVEWQTITISLLEIDSDGKSQGKANASIRFFIDTNENTDATQL